MWEVQYEMSNIEQGMSNDEGHDPLHTKNATSTPAAPQAVTVRGSSFGIRYSLEACPLGSPASRRGLRDQQDFPSSLTTFQEAVCLGGLLERQGLADAEPELSGSYPIEHVPSSLKQLGASQGVLL